MSRGFGHVVSRAWCLAAAVGLLAVASPGCGGDSKQGTAESGGIPPAVKESNDEMQNFMKNQKGAPKAR